MRPRAKPVRTLRDAPVFGKQVAIPTSAQIFWIGSGLGSNKPTTSVLRNSSSSNKRYGSVVSWRNNSSLFYCSSQYDVYMTPVFFSSDLTNSSVTTTATETGLGDSNQKIAIKQKNLLLHDSSSRWNIHTWIVERCVIVFTYNRRVFPFDTLWPLP